MDWMEQLKSFNFNPSTVQGGDFRSGGGGINLDWNAPIDNALKTGQFENNLNFGLGGEGGDSSSGFSMDNLYKGANVASNLVGAWGGIRGMREAGKQNKYMRALSDLNLNNQVNTINTNVSDRAASAFDIAARNAALGGAENTLKTPEEAVAALNLQRTV